MRDFDPPYEFILEIDVDDECINAIAVRQELDTYQAITIYEENLTKFNSCVNFVVDHGI